MNGRYHNSLLPGQPRHALHDHQRSVGIEAAGGLVQGDDARCSNAAARDAQPPLLPAADPPHRQAPRQESPHLHTLLHVVSDRLVRTVALWDARHSLLCRMRWERLPSLECGLSIKAAGKFTAVSARSDLPVKLVSALPAYSALPQQALSFSDRDSLADSMQAVRNNSDEGPPAMALRSFLDLLTGPLGFLCNAFWAGRCCHASQEECCQSAAPGCS